MAEETKKEKKSHISEEAREHLKTARKEMRESIRAFLPPEYLEHRDKARKEVLLAWRTMIDEHLKRMEEGKK